MPLVKLKFFAEPVERTEDEIEELRAGGLLDDDQTSVTAPPAKETPAKDKKES